MRSSAIGVKSVAVGRDSIAIGPFTKADRSHAVAIGSEAYAASNSVAVGRNARADGPKSIAIGEEAKSGDGKSFCECSVAIGRLAHADGDMTTAIGNGAYATSEATAIGNGAKAEEYEATAIGDYAEARGESSVALGVRAETDGRLSSAIGVYTTESGVGASAIGSYTTAPEDGSTAIGARLDENGEIYGAFASSANSLALAYYPSEIFLGAYDGSDDEKSLQDYLDEKADKTNIVTGVNGQSGEVTLDCDDIGAIPAETFSRWEGTVVAGGNTFDVRSKSCEANGRVAADVPWEYRKALYGGGEIWLGISDGGHPVTYAPLAEYTWHFQTIYSQNGKHSTMPYLHDENTGTNYYFSGEVKTVSLPLEVSVRKILSPTVALTAEEEARGVTYVKNGLDQNCAIAIGENAKASVDPDYVARAPSNAVLRSVSVAIGGNADARGDGTGTSQGVAIGWWAQAKAGNAVAIGSSAQHTNETAMGGNATVANAACAVALGYSAKAAAPSAVQIGFGTNATPHSLQFEGVPIVRDGRLVAPGVETADVRRVVGEMLAPRTVTDVGPDGEVKVQSHAITTLAPTNGTLDEIVVEATATRNYEIYVPNVAAARESLPMLFDTEGGDVAKLGAWWGRKALRLPALVKVREPVRDTVILDVETYDDGWDWTPRVTNATFSATGNVIRLEKVLGVNLHGVTEVRVAYEGTDGKTNEVVSTAVRNPLYGKVEPEIAAIPQGGFADGAGVTVTASGETGTCAFAADPFAEEEGGQ